MYEHTDGTTPERFCMARLRRFASLAAASAPWPQDRRRLARHATLSAYRDCVALGLEVQAHEILRETVGAAGAAVR